MLLNMGVSFILCRRNISRNGIFYIIILSRKMTMLFNAPVLFKLLTFFYL